ncbi:hypothetical protein MRX96_047741 [Rhipicephalus microplus]
MTDSRMCDEASEKSENDEENLGWRVAAGRRSCAEKKISAGVNVVPCNSPLSSGDATTDGGRRAANAFGAFKKRIV